LENSVPRRLYVNDHDKILVFERGGLIFAFNFHSVSSVVNYSIIVPPGEYRLMLDSDRTEFGGIGRIDPDQNFSLMNDMRDTESCNIIKVYLPCRTAMVIKRILPRK